MKRERNNVRVLERCCLLAGAVNSSRDQIYMFCNNFSGSPSADM